LPDGSGGFRQDLTCPALLRIPLGTVCISCTGLSPSMVQLSRQDSTTHTESTLWSYNPGPAETAPVWAVPCSLATTRGITTCFLFLQVLRCFSSLGLLPFQDNWSSTSWVAPFGNPRITGYYAPPRGLSQPIASFIASESQGIHRTPLVTFRSAQDLIARWTDRSVCFGRSNNMSKNGCPMGSVENIGVEPMTSCLQSRRSSQLS